MRAASNRFRGAHLRAVAALAILCALAPRPASAQDLDDDAALRAIRAAVKVVMLTPGGGGSTGSGSMIDPRGYVLTNFHVVGHMRPETGTPGTLFNADNRVHLATVDDARQSARPRWIGVVVRGDVRLDLALIRIVADVDGNPVRSASFPTIPMANTRALRPGSRVWAFGYPLGVRTINVTQGSVAGFQMNAHDDVAWLRSDAEFNPGNSGGMLVDARGQLVAVPTQVYHGRGRALEPVELARPVERIPVEWLEALRQGSIDDTRIGGVAAVGPGRPVRDVAFGDHGTLDAPDQHFYTLAGVSGAARVRTEPALPIALLHREGLLREGRGAVELTADDPRDTVISVLVPNAAEQPVQYAVVIESAATEVAAMPTGTVDFGELANAPPSAPAPRAAPNPFDPPPTPAAPAGFSIRGALVDGTGGRPVASAWVFVGRPDADLQGALTAFLQGRLSEQQLDTMLVGVSRSDVRGLYALRGLPAGRFPFALVAEGYRPQFLTLTLVDPSQPDVDLGVVRLTH